jgi:stage II sporulation protein D
VNPQRFHPLFFFLIIASPLPSLASLPGGNLDRYAAGVAASEMPKSFPLQARIAQEIAARSFYVQSGKPKNIDFTEMFQFLRPEYQQSGTTPLAAGLVMNLPRGILPEYHARCPGYVFNPLNGEKRICPLHSQKPFTWNAVLKPTDTTTDIAEAILRAKNLPERRRLRLPERSTLKSPFIDQLIKLEDKTIIRGRGHGHGVGMCQWGAKYLAEQGATYLEILRQYYGPHLQLSKHDNPIAR